MAACSRGPPCWGDANIDDFRGRWPARLVERRQIAAAAFHSRLARLSALYWGVDLGEGCIFFGRTLFHRAAGSVLAVGDRCVFRSATWSNLAGLDRPCMISTLMAGAELTVGADCGLSGTVVAAAQSVVLGERVFCGANVTITDTDWHGVLPSTRNTRGASSPVHIEKDVWIGMNAVILKSVTVGEGSVVAAGSVVTKPVPSGVVVAGNPARVVQELQGAMQPGTAGPP